MSEPNSAFEPTCEDARGSAQSLEGERTECACTAGVSGVVVKRSAVGPQLACRRAHFIGARISPPSAIHCSSVAVASTRSACRRSPFVRWRWRKLVDSSEWLSFGARPVGRVRSAPVFGGASRSSVSPPNKSLEPTPVRNALLSVGSGAAQLVRWAS